MKILINKLKTIFLLVLLSTFAVSCLDDEGYTDLANGIGRGDYILSWAGSQGTANNIVLSLPSQASYDYPMAVTLSSSEVPDKDYTITVSVDASLIDIVNEGLDPSDQFQLMPDSVYDLIETEIVVKKGQPDASYFVRFYPAKIDGSKIYMLPLQLSSADESIVVSANQGTAKLSIIGNKYAGTYTSSYHFTRETSPGVFSETDWVEPKTFEAIDSKFLYVKYAAYSVFSNPTIYFKISVNANNTVNIISAQSEGAGVNMIPTPGETSTYDPGTKTFDLYYEYSNASGLLRRFHDVCVLQ